MPNSDTTRKVNDKAENKMGDEGASALSKALKDNTTLTALKMESAYFQAMNTPKRVLKHEYTTKTTRSAQEEQ